MNFSYKLEHRSRKARRQLEFGVPYHRHDLINISKILFT